MKFKKFLADPIFSSIKKTFCFAEEFDFIKKKGSILFAKNIVN